MNGENEQQVSADLTSEFAASSSKNSLPGSSSESQPLTSGALF